MGTDLEKSLPDQDTGKVLPKSLKIITTAAIFFGNICFGAAYNAYGPAVKDLENKYDTDVDSISKVFTIMTIGYLVGALLTGFVYNFLSRQMGVILLLSGMAVSMYLTPHCPTLVLFFCAGGLLGVSVGAYDSSQVVWVMEIWQEESAPFIQTQHFFYALGSLVPPLLLAPFLTKDSEDSEDSVTVVSNTSLKPTRNPDMYIPFTIIGALCSAAVLWQLYLFLFKRYYPPPPEVGRLDAKKVKDLNNNPDLDSTKQSFLARIGVRKLKLIVLSAIFLGAYQGMEMCTMQFMPTFTQEGDLDLTEAEGAYITSGFSGAYTLGRFLGIIAVLKIRPQFIILTNLILICCANVILLLFANSSLPMLWVGAIMIGFGFSTIYPSFCVYIERHLLFTNAIGAVMLITGSGVAAIYPLVVGGYIEDNNRVLTYVNFFSLFWMILAGLILYKMTYKDAKKLGKQ